MFNQYRVYLTMLECLRAEAWCAIIAQLRIGFLGEHKIVKQVIY